MSFLTIKIPDIYKNPYLRQNIVIQDRNYEFEYIWNNRANFCLLNIYINTDDTLVKIISGLPLIQNSIWTKYINNEDWIGDFSLIDITDKNRRPTQKNISTDFILLWTDELDE